MIKQLLGQLGFNEKEIIIYLEILKQSKVSPADLAKITNINRTTVYAVIEELLKKGIIKKDLGTPTATLVALPPEELNSIIAAKEQKIRQEKHIVEELVHELKDITKEAKYSIPKITFIEEKNVENYLYKHAPVWDKSMLETDPTWWGFQDHTFVEHFHKWIDWYWKSCVPEKISLKLLSNKSGIEEQMEKEKYPRRHIKYWQDSGEFSVSIWVDGDYVIMVMTRQRPHYLVEIYDKVLAQNLRLVFKKIWVSINVN